MLTEADPVTSWDVLRQVRTAGLIQGFNVHVHNLPACVRYCIHVTSSCLYGKNPTENDRRLYGFGMPIERETINLLVCRSFSKDNTVAGIHSMMVRIYARS